MAAAERDKAMEATWEASFRDQVERGAFNTAPVEALVRTVAHHLRATTPQDSYRSLKFLEVGCGAGPNLIWLAEKGIEVHGVDISPLALELARRNFGARGLEGRLRSLEHGSATALPYGEASFDGVLESCVFQHLSAEDRRKAFAEMARVLKPGGIFAGHMLNRRHTTFAAQQWTQDPDDPGTLRLTAGNGEKVNLESIGLAHFFSREEFAALLPDFAVVDPCELTYELPRSEASRRGYDHYMQAMWVLYAVK